MHEGVETVEFRCW